MLLLVDLDLYLPFWFILFMNRYVPLLTLLPPLFVLVKFFETGTHVAPSWPRTCFVAKDDLEFWMTLSFLTFPSTISCYLLIFV